MTHPLQYIWRRRRKEEEEEEEEEEVTVFANGGSYKDYLPSCNGGLGWALRYLNGSTH